MCALYLLLMFSVLSFDLFWLFFFFVDVLKMRLCAIAKTCSINNYYSTWAIQRVGMVHLVKPLKKKKKKPPAIMIFLLEKPKKLRIFFLRLIHEVTQSSCCHEVNTYFTDEVTHA